MRGPQESAFDSLPCACRVTPLIREVLVPAGSPLCLGDSPTVGPAFCRRSWDVVRKWFSLLGLKDVKRDSERGALLTAAPRERLPGIIQRIISGIGKALRLLFEIPHQHRHVTRSEPRVQHAPHVARVRGILKIMQECLTVFAELLAEGFDTGRIPTHGRIRSTDCPHPPIGQASNGLYSEQLLQDRGDQPPLTAVALDEASE